MTLPTNDALFVDDDPACHEISIEELEAIAAGHNVEYDSPSGAHYEESAYGVERMRIPGVRVREVRFR
jgi:hypothetical protein